MPKSQARGSMGKGVPGEWAFSCGVVGDQQSWSETSSSVLISAPSARRKILQGCGFPSQLWELWVAAFSLRWRDCGRGRAMPPVPPEMKPSSKQKPPPGEQSYKTRHWPVPCPSAVLGWLRTHCHVLPSHRGIKVPGGCHPIWEPFQGGNSPCPC